MTCFIIFCGLYLTGDVKGVRVMSSMARIIGFWWLEWDRGGDGEDRSDWRHFWQRTWLQVRQDQDFSPFVKTTSAIPL